MNSLVKASVRAAVAGVPDFGPACPYCSCRTILQSSASADCRPFRRCEDCGSFLCEGNGGRLESASAEPVFRNPAYWASRADWMERLLTYPPHRILDLDCQDGAFLNAWPWTMRRDGIEPRPELAELAIASGLRVFTGEPADFRPDVAYDLIAWFGGFAGLRGIRARVERASRWLAPGGLLIIGAPTPDCMRHRFGAKIAPSGWIDPTHTAGYPSRKWLTEAVEEAGFERVAEAWTDGGIAPPTSRGEGFLKRLPAVGRWVAHAGPLTHSAYFDYYEAAFRRL